MASRKFLSFLEYKFQAQNLSLKKFALVRLYIFKYAS